MAAKTLPLQGGAKLQAAEDRRKSVLFFARRVRRGACETSVSGFCRSGRIFAALVRLGECEVFASELALAEACAGPKIGAARRPQIGGPKFGAALPFWQLKVGPPRGPVIGPGERRSQKDYGGVAACECLRATPLSI